VDRHRLRPVPSEDEVAQVHEVRRFGRDLAGRLLDDVGERKMEVAIRLDRRRPLDGCAGAQELTSERAPVLATVSPMRASEQM